MQIRKVQKKSTYILYLIVFFVAASISYHENSTENDVSITFSAKTPESGWIIEKSSEEEPSSAFASESSLLNALKIKIEGNLQGGIKYTFHETNGNWLKWAKDGQVSNITDNNASLNAVKVTLYGDVSKKFNILYRIKTKGNNWSKWVKNGVVAGNENSTNPISGLQVKVESKSPIASIKKLVNQTTKAIETTEEANEGAAITSDLTPLVPTEPSTISNLKPLDKELKGIDVSYYNGTINWKKVKESGVNFAIIQVGYRGCTQGTLKNDEQFERNIKGAIENNIKVGIYFVTQALTVKEAEEEADFVLKRISNYSIDYPVYIDIEDVDNARQLRLNTAERTKVCKAFCDKIYEAGYETGVYSCQYYFESKLHTRELLKYNIWVAAYQIRKKPSTNFAYQMWQCSETGRISGISTNVDINYVYYDYENYTRELSASAAPTTDETATTEPNPEN